MAPGEGHIDFASVVQTIRASGYLGWIGTEVLRVADGSGPTRLQEDPLSTFVASCGGPTVAAAVAHELQQRGQRDSLLLRDEARKGGRGAVHDAHKRYEIGFKDVKVAAVSAVGWSREREEAECRESSYLCAIEHADDFFARIWVEMQRRGVDPERQPLVFLGDGASWIWNRVKDLSNGKSIEILDFWHASEHLSDLCKVLFGELTPDYWQHFSRWKKMFLKGRVRAVLRELKKLAGETRSKAKLKALLDQLSYFEDNLQRMAYGKFRRMRLPIGSGTVESACKNVIGSRMKQGGMTWSVGGADGMLQIRSSQESERFQSDFLSLLQTAA